ncbi:MAG: hypothetical protein IRZ00_19840 [Gemmatimonadetes bacterium]|nr:hypothetical protein [Gemmatimonadota bacterium]
MNSRPLPPTDEPRQIEALLAGEIENLPGVIAAAIHLGPAAEIREVYIAAAPGASAVDLQSATVAVLARHGIDIAPAVVRVGAIHEPGPSAAAGSTAEEPQPAPSPDAPAWQGRFILLEGVDIQTSGGHVVCRVRLRRQGELLEGEARELDTELGRARAAARATIAAVEDASPFALGLEGAAFVDLFARRYVVVSVEASASRRFVTLAGLIALEPNRPLEEAATLATIRAIERFISW